MTVMPLARSLLMAALGRTICQPTSNLLWNGICLRALPPVGTEKKVNGMVIYFSLGLQIGVDHFPYLRCSI